MYVFKAAALQGIRNLFPSHSNPFYAAFGSTQCDIMAYTRCDIPEGRIYMIQHDSTLHPNLKDEPINATNKSKLDASLPMKFVVYNPNHVNFKYTIKTIAEEYFENRFPDIRTEVLPLAMTTSLPAVQTLQQQSNCVGTTGKSPVPAAVRSVNSVDSLYCGNNYWKISVPIVD